MSEEEYRPLDGHGNNIENPDWGACCIPLKRLTRVAYEDDKSSPSGANRPNPREISNIVLSQIERTFNRKNATDYFWVWGQFLDHDITLTPESSQEEYFNIQVPKGDPWFDPAFTGDVIIPLKRSNYIEGTGPREQINGQSSFIDASNVYGATAARASVLRLNNGTGKLKTGPEGLLPYNTIGMPNAPNSDAKFYLAGDVRANEQPLLTAFHAIWVKEHNRIAHELNFQNPDWTGEQLYQEARKKVIALNQVITFKEFLPMLLGDNISPYIGYDPTVDPSVYNIFATATYRLGHSLVSSELLRLKEDLSPISEGPLRLRDGFFNPAILTVGGGIEPLLRGAARQVCERLDVRTVTELRNFLFGNPGQGGMDLASLNIQRGRDHGLPSYNDAREDFGLPRKASFDEITTDAETVARLVQVYSSVDDIDIWVGGLAEDPYKDAMVGELFYMVNKRQFEALRDGDRFWYQNIYDGEELEEIESTRFIDVIRRNTLIRDEIQDNIFRF